MLWYRSKVRDILRDIEIELARELNSGTFANTVGGDNDADHDSPFNEDMEYFEVRSTYSSGLHSSPHIQDNSRVYFI